MKNLLIAGLFAAGTIVGVEAAPTDMVTKADIQALVERLNKLEAENQAQAKRIAELEGLKCTKAAAAAEAKAQATVAMDPGTTTNETGRIYTTESGKKYYLADATKNIFEPLSESGLQITPYGYLVLEGVYSTRQLDGDYTTDFVSPNSQRRNHTTLSVQDSILGLQFDTPEPHNGWKFTGRAEFDLVDTSNVDQNHYGFHWRHLYVNAEHESGWSILGGQTWHLWKIVTPSEIDGAWMEQAGHPYRRSPQIRVTKKWNWDDSSFEARVGIVKGGPGMGEDRDGDTIQDNTASPWVLFEGAAIYDHDAAWQDDKRRWLVGLGGQWGRNRSHRFCSAYGYGGDEDDYDSAMGLIAAKAPFGDFTLTGQFFGGQNLGGIQAGCGQSVVYHNFYGTEFVKGNAVRTIGGFVDLGYQLNEDWSFAVGYGCDDPVDSDVEGGVGGSWPYPGVLFNDRIYADVFYQVTPNFKLGLEYARLLTSYANGTLDNTTGGDFAADRVQFSAFYDF